MDPHTFSNVFLSSQTDPSDSGERRPLINCLAGGANASQAPTDEAGKWGELVHKLLASGAASTPATSSAAYQHHQQHHQQQQQHQLSQQQHQSAITNDVRSHLSIVMDSLSMITTEASTILSTSQSLAGILQPASNFTTDGYQEFGLDEAGAPGAPASDEPRLEALSERWQVYLALLYTLTAVTSFILNLVAVIVLSRHQRNALRKYLMNLCISDLLMSLFSIPFTYTEYMLGRWVFFSSLCPLVRFAVTLSVFVSAATMTMIGINRHWVVMRPLESKHCPALAHRSGCLISAIWLVGVAISVPEYLMFAAEPFCFKSQLHYDCRQVWSESVSNMYTIFIYMCTFAIPLSLLCYLYTCIGLRLWRRQMPGEVDPNRDLNVQTKSFKAIRMLFVIVILFAVSWLPLQTFSMVMFLFPQIRSGFQYQSTGYNIFVGTYFACHWLSMAHSCINPLIYCFMDNRFLTDLKRIIFGRNSAVALASCEPTRAHTSCSAVSWAAAKAASGARRSTGPANHDHQHARGPSPSPPPMPRPQARCERDHAHQQVAPAKANTGRQPVAHESHLCAHLEALTEREAATGGLVAEVHARAHCSGPKVGPQKCVVSSGAHNHLSLDVIESAALV